MKKIIYTRPDGGLSVVHPVEGARLGHSITLADGTVLDSNDPVQRLTKQAPQPVPVDELRRGWPVAGAIANWAETEDEFLARVKAKVLPADAINSQIVDEAAVPTDRTFRNAWEQAGATVTVSMAKARNLQEAEINRRRREKIRDLLEREALGENVTADKATVRAVNARTLVNSATTTEELKAVMPTELL